MEAGRLDIAINVIISALFLSHDIRKDVKLHLLFDGPPTPPVHILIQYDEKLPISKKDVAGLIKRILYKAPKEKGKTTNPVPGCFAEKKYSWRKKLRTCLYLCLYDAKLHRLLVFVTFVNFSVVFVVGASQFVWVK
jgi:tRNA pseudouridine-54 N-methylase